MAEELPTTSDIQDQISKMGSLFSGGVLNPLAKEQVRIEVPEIPVAPMPTGPASQIPKLSGNYSGELDTPMKYAMALKNHVENAGTWARDQYKYGKNYAYDADYTGLNFARYYNAPKVYNKVGFSPWRNNEQIYNEKMSWWDSFKRSAGQAGRLFGTGFSSMTPWNAWDGEDTDEKSAKEMERAHAIGADNKGGVGSFFNNLMLDSGYTLGIGAEFAVEELALWGATALTEGALGEVALARTSANVARLSKSLGTTEKVLGKTNEALKALSDVSKSRDVWKAVKAGKPVGAVMDILTPQTWKFISETASMSKAAKAAKTGENIYTLARASKGAGAFYRDAREIAAVLSESKLEGGSVELEMRNKLTDEFYNKNGRMPNANEYQEIFNAAHDAGRETYLYNLPALWISNKIVFDKALKGFSPMQTFRKELSEGLAGKLSFDKAAALAGQEAWSVIKTGLKADAESLFKKATWAPKNLMKNGVGKLAMYTKENLTEALQEQYQDAVANSMKEYYESRFTHPGRSTMHEAWGDIFARNVGKQFTTAAGWETFASGFLMGSLVQIPQHIVYQKVPEKFYQITDPQGYQTFKAQREERTNNVVKALNEMTKDPQKFFNPNVTNAVTQGILNDHASKAAEDGDIKQYGDIKDESIFEHIHTLLQTDKLDLIRDYLKDMKGLDSTELEQAYGKIEDTKEDAKTYYTNKIDGMLRRMDEIENRSKFVEDKYGNPFNPHKFSPGKDSQKYNDEAYKWQAWEWAKKQAVFSGYSFDRTVDRMHSIMQDLANNAPIDKAPGSDFTVLFDRALMTEEIKTLRSEISAMKDVPGTKREMNRKAQKLEALEQFNKEVAYYRDVLKSNSKLSEETEESKEIFRDSIKNLQKAFSNYAKVLGKQYDVPVFSTRLNSAFEKLRDYHHLKNDSLNLAGVVNMLENPEMFALYAQRFEKVAKTLHETRSELYRKSAKSAEHTKDFNELLNQIMETGAYLYPEDINPLFKEFKIPTHFYDITTGEVIKPEDEKFKKIVDLIAKYVQANKPVEEVVEKKEEPVTTTKTEGEVKITKNTPLDIIEKEHPELMDTLIDGYRDFNKKLGQDAREDESPEDLMLVPTALTMTDDQVKKHPSFKSFLALPAATTILVKYNEDTGRTIEPEVIQGVAQTTVQKPKYITESMRDALKDLGYTTADIGKMTYKEGERIINGAIKPGSEAAKKIAEQAAAEQKKQESHTEALSIINSMLEKVNTLSDLEGFHKGMLEFIESEAFSNSGLTSDIIDEMINEKRDELRVTFDDLTKGDIVRIAGQKTVMIVDEKTADSVKFHRYGDPTKKLIINKEDIKESVIWKEGMPDVTSQPTNEDNEDLQDAKKDREDLLADEERRKKLEDQSKSESENDLLDGLGSNCTPNK